MSFDSTAAESIADEAIETLNKQFADRGIQFDKPGGIRYSPTTLNFKVRAGAPGVDPEKEGFERNCVHFGLESTDYGREFTYRRDSYRIAGINPRAKKFPISAESAKNGKIYGFPAHLVREALK